MSLARYLSKLGALLNSSGQLTATGLQDAAVTAAKLATEVKPLGVGQTWQNVIGSRLVGTTYTNTTGRPIMVHINGYGSTSANAVRIIVDGVVMRDAFDVTVGSVQTVVPNGSTYLVQTPNGINDWCELR